MSPFYKYILASIFFGSAVVHIDAQSFSVSQNNITAVGTTHSQFEGRVTVKNNTPYTQSLRWSRTLEQTPGNWETQVCDEQCYHPNIKSRVLTLLPRQERELRVVFYPHGQQGNGEVNLSIFSPADSAGTSKVVSFEGSTAVAAGAASASSARTPLKIFPNPAVTHIQIEENDQVARIEIYNMIGRKVTEYSVNEPDEKYSVSQLPRGVYFVRMYDKSGNILFTQRISKTNP